MNASSRSFGLRRLAGDVAETFLARLAILALSFGLAALLGRALGVEAFGAYSLAVLLPTFLTMLLNLGAATANVYFIGRGDVSPRHALKTSLRIWIVLSLLGLAVGATAIGWKGAAVFPGVSPRLLWIGLGVFPVLLLRSFLVSLLQAVGDFRWYNRVQVLDVAGTLALTMGAILVLDLGTAGALVAYCLGTLVAMAVSVRALRRHLLRRPDVQEIDHYACKSLRYGWKASVANFFAFLNYRADLLLVNWFLGGTATGVYVCALLITEKLWLLSQAASAVVLPRLSSLHAEADLGKHLAPIVSRWVLYVTLLPAALLAVVARPMLSFVFGPEFAEATGALRWLLPGIILCSFLRVIANDFAARGLTHLNMCRACLVVAVNVCANLVLIPRFGICGAAVASTLGYVVLAAVTLYLYARISGNRWTLPFLPNRMDWRLAVTAAGALRDYLRGHRLTAADVPVGAGSPLEIPRPAGSQGGGKLSRYLRFGVASILLGGIATSYLELRQQRWLAPLRNRIVLGRPDVHESKELICQWKSRDAEGINPVQIALKVRPAALSVLDRDDSMEPDLAAPQRRELLEVADYFVRSGTTGRHDGLSFRAWPYHFDWPKYAIKAPWYSGIAQAFIIEDLLAAHRLTGREAYLRAAREAANALAVPIRQGGVAVPTGGGLWFEEYASPDVKPPMVLNGHCFALEALEYLRRVDPAYAVHYRQGVRALKPRLEEFDRYVWSHYDLAGTPANQKYHLVHERQMRQLYEQTGDAVFDRFARRFRLQRMLPFGAFYRLGVYPNRYLVVLFAGNSIVALGLIRLLITAGRWWRRRRSARLVDSTEQQWTQDTLSAA